MDFVRPVDDRERERLLVREDPEGVELALLLPRRLLEKQGATDDPDMLLQALEGVSHFVYLAERVRTGLPSTQLELELQAEVDKFVLLAVDEPPLAGPDRARLRERLFEHVRFLHEEGSEAGDRYRMANSLAARYLCRLEVLHTPRAFEAELRRFYRAGQTEKIWMARAA